MNRDEAGKVTGLKFDFTDLEPVKVKDAVCPLCGGEIIQTPFGYGCANYSKDNPERLQICDRNNRRCEVKGGAGEGTARSAAERKSSKGLSQRPA
ncbi:MAG: hypothetical protein ACLVCH_01965 [Roseburia inulinivorans]